MKLVDVLARDLKVWPEGFDRIHGYMWAYFSLANYAETPWFNESATQEGWQAAVDALKAESSPAWVGVGLPPVGTVCEAKSCRTGEYRECIVLAHRNEMAVVTFTDQEELQWSTDLRPIRTPEQIAEENREAAITDIAFILGKDPDRPAIREKAGTLYDAGYRKQEADK